mmetsp:Transcript_18749/g.24146  ORF Transcript_18749/g.24146 Transcript_18749/m.24146 type:complete len:212 (-) Transcript_18749:178-813(-)|eukprot:CAMPEP_0198139712 /NCGR_PEP_ID=MMETSP1443-20131203/2965_1 /TAXON_ID=186043 /ORGANISM="Entomoneis sp., Strain CCMP2396" /LENGTH=211 /DNA_ID=CAMNT_0043801915 /DNA_START=91 /DNA_END=726 /DNA_ORIENTATION=+
MSQVIQGYELCPSWAPAFGYMGASLCMILSSFGSAWGTWRAGLGVCHMGIDHPAGIIKTIVPIVMAGVLGIYGLIVAVIIAQAVVPPNQADGTNTYSSFNGYVHLAAGLCCGLSCLAAGGTIGIIGDVGVRAFGLVAENGCKWFWDPAAIEAGGEGDGGGADHVPMFSKNSAENSNKLYVGMLVMLIFSEALALYGLIVALILSQHNYLCE